MLASLRGNFELDALALLLVEVVDGAPELAHAAGVHLLLHHPAVEPAHHAHAPAARGHHLCGRSPTTLSPSCDPRPFIRRLSTLHESFPSDISHPLLPTPVRRASAPF
eukprot:7690297-Pyramimonas_sp.AAC.1